ncbi:hypothetical protein N9M71_00790 [Winogradskyella sp.]|nr:hypothetical protein [Winogradskyella sp.]
MIPASFPAPSITSAMFPFVPGPCNVVIKSALINAAARELKPLATATSTTL